MIHMDIDSDSEVLSLRFQVRWRALLTFLRTLTAILIALGSLLSALVHILMLLGWI